ncbi:MAG: FkbM family methyltransferase [Pirellulales bacterium]|nr:FkbM family methyltransferase [Pirellulales bacterium]
MSLARLFRRRPEVPFAEWGHEVRDFHLPHDGRVQYAQWLHPYETPKTIDPAEVAGLRRFIRPGDFVIDVGAHTGDTTVPLALAAGASGCVLALEPNPHVFNVLAVNAALNRDKTRIEPRCYAATEEPGQFVFHYSDASFCNGGFKSQQRWKLFRRKYPLTVEGRPLAEVLRNEFASRLPRLSFVKVDAEGYDRAVLASILPILREYRPVIRTEVFRKLVARERHELFELLADNGYSVHRFQGGAAPEGERVAKADMTAAKHFDLLAIPATRQFRRAA